LLGVERYANLDRVRGATDVADAQDALKAVGFDVQAQTNGAGADMTRKLTEFVSGIRDAERLVVGMSGAFVTDGDRSWLLPVDVSDPILFNLAGAVSIESVLRVLAATPGQVVLVIGRDTTADDAYGPYVRDGLGDLDIPNGVTVVTANTGAAADLLVSMAKPGADVMALVRASGR
jgi:hypothetical protein